MVQITEDLLYFIAGKWRFCQKLIWWILIDGENANPPKLIYPPIIISRYNL